LAKWIAVTPPDVSSPPYRPFDPVPDAQLTLKEALRLIREAGKRADAHSTYTVGLACSFTPLHLETFVRGYVARKRPNAVVGALTGIYGDLPGTIEKLSGADVDSCVVVIEWADLDPRLGCREAVSAQIADLEDIANTARHRLERIASRLEILGRECPTAVALPTLGLPAAYDGSLMRIGELRARLNLMLSEFTARAVRSPGLRVVAPEAVAGNGTPTRDLRSEIRSGFPYSVPHASSLARACVEILLPPATKKGLITDLDDTLWRGLVGEIGPDAVSWDLDSGSQAHALYQQLLAALSQRGALVAVASKNDPEVVQKALERSDLHLPVDTLYPISVSWGPKSQAVDQVLAAWNIAASDVVFVDDSPMELAEVKAKHPAITPILFPAEDPNAVASTLSQLASMFWRERVNAEDSLRLASLRSASKVAEARRDAGDERAFLEDLGGRITIRSGRSWAQPRTLELVNKTNQFNLNGRRFDETQWRKLCTRPGVIVWAISYEDRFGPLGVISVLAGLRAEREIRVDCWVLSCRAFSRAIEHHILRELCEGVDRVLFDFTATERNAVFRNFLEQVASPGDSTAWQLDSGVLREHPMIGIHDMEHEIER
jgi:FkbH-like protein